MTVNRVTPKMIENEIAHFSYFTAAEGSAGSVLEDLYTDTATTVSNAAHSAHNEHERAHPSLHLLTFCVLVLKNGYTVTGQSSCVDPATFNPLTGREIALENAKEKVWPLLGFRLKDAAK